MTWRKIMKHFICMTVMIFLMLSNLFTNLENLFISKLDAKFQLYLFNSHKFNFKNRTGKYFCVVCWTKIILVVCRWTTSSTDSVFIANKEYVVQIRFWNAKSKETMFLRTKWENTLNPTKFVIWIGFCFAISTNYLNQNPHNTQCTVLIEERSHEKIINLV